MKTKLFLVTLVALAILGGMALMGTNPLESPVTFVVCLAISIVVAVAVVGHYVRVYGPPEITRSRKP